tara:strand:- start:250 stop:447 length:198 start_codon:yes stop_codon:yes gene_type:complete
MKKLFFCTFLSQLILFSLNINAQIFFEDFSSGDLGQFNSLDNDSDGYIWRNGYSSEYGNIAMSES